MFSCVSSACLSGSRVIPVRIEVDIQPGLPYFTIIGLADKRIDEAPERIRSAIKNSGFSFPLGKVTVNLCPSDMQKHGTGLDLAIALGILIASGFLPPLESSVWVLGELSLDGTVQKITSLLPLLLEADIQKISGSIIPASNYADAALLSSCRVNCWESLKKCTAMLRQPLAFKELKNTDLPATRVIPLYDIDNIQGHLEPKRLLSIAMAGGHSLLLTGPPGIGKTILAQAAHQLLPYLEGEALREVARLYAFAGESFSFRDAAPPIRSPHHTATVSTIFGGGVPVRPGEISLAHRGVLLLDELPRFSKQVRDVLLKPMQEKEIVIQRQGTTSIYPASCTMIATRNACYCGRLSAEDTTCICTAGELQRYSKLLSEPLLDRFELFYYLEALHAGHTLNQNIQTEYTGSYLAQLVAKAQMLQRKRNRGGKLNGELPHDELSLDTMTKTTQAYLNKAADRFSLSLRRMHTVVKVARTIADMAGELGVQLLHLQEALHYHRRPNYRP